MTEKDGQDKISPSRAAHRTSSPCRRSLCAGCCTPDGQVATEDGGTTSLRRSPACRHSVIITTT